jgi:hypothetical protein
MKYTIIIEETVSAEELFTNGLGDLVAEVPAERVINAVPFYTRLWRTTGGGG